MIAWPKRSADTWIKLCEFEALDPVLESTRLGADALGFHIFCHQDEKERCARFAPIVRMMPPGVHAVLLTDLPLARVRRVLQAVPFTALQLYQDCAAEDVVKLREQLRRPIPILKVMSAQPRENFTPSIRDFVEYYAPCVDAFLLDSSRRGGSGQTAEWDHCARVIALSPRPVILAGGLTPENVGAAIRTLRPFGVDVETGVSERAPNGVLVKDMGKVAKFIAAVREADRCLLGENGQARTPCVESIAPLFGIGGVGYAIPGLPIKG